MAEEHLFLISKTLSISSFFLERQVLSHFLSIMEQKCGSYVIVQLLQTLNILFENIKHDTSLCEFTWRFRHVIFISLRTSLKLT